MVNPTPPPPAVNPQATSHQEIKTRVPVVKPDTAHPVGASQEANRSQKSKHHKGKDKDGKSDKGDEKQASKSSDDYLLDISI